MGHLGHSHGTLGTLQITYGTLGTLAWDTWDTPNYVWDTWDTHVGHYIWAYLTNSISVTDGICTDFSKFNPVNLNFIRRSLLQGYF